MVSEPESRHIVVCLILWKVGLGDEETKVEASVYEVYVYYRFEHRRVSAAEIYEGLLMFQGQREAGV